MTNELHGKAREAYEFWSGFGTSLNDHPLIKGKAAELGICPPSRRPTDAEVYKVFLVAHGWQQGEA